VQSECNSIRALFRICQSVSRRLIRRQHYVRVFFQSNFGPKKLWRYLMVVQSVSTLSVLAGVLFVIYCRPMRIIRFDSIWESIFWTLRAWYWRYPVPLDIDQWRLTNPRDVALYRREALAIQRAWKFLGPFFASCGYTLYRNEPPALFTLLPPLAPAAAINPSHPFAHRAFKEDIEIEFYFVVRIVWHR
jgi:hypothetical protein